MFVKRIVKYETATCVPCKLQDAILEKLVADHPEIEIEHVDCVSVNVSLLNITSVPVLMFVDDSGAVVHRLDGLTDLKVLEHTVTELNDVLADEGDDE